VLERSLSKKQKETWMSKKLKDHKIRKAHLPPPTSMANTKPLQLRALRLILNPQENTLATKIVAWENLQNTDIGTKPLVAWLAEQDLAYTNKEVVRTTQCIDNYKIFHRIKQTVMGPGLPIPCEHHHPTLEERTC
jgi:hypothetical protein